MKVKVIMFALLACCFLFMGKNLVESYFSKQEFFGRIQSFTNNSYFTGQPAITVQCYKIVIPEGKESESSLLWADASSETGVSGTDSENGIVCFSLNPGETKWIFTKVKKTDFFSENNFEIKYELLKKDFNPAADIKQERIDRNKKTVPRLI
ncbi:MAG: hypothetical protein WCX23_01365 [Candidatus Paceibacterota bacterium]|jgi:hypothetical protein|nr:hypothetical protein [Candidatus Paceibacterota bacterium]MDD4830539.1 hypothetical protein [Candidatus Paceibacterota bacterium]MDD4874792.1 hypothetical protein [Candidatus Paceibacterota bacterium]